MKRFTFQVPYNVVQWKTVTVEAEDYPHAESGMLAHMLDLGLDVRPEWKLDEPCRSLSCQGPWYRDHNKSECK